MTPPTAVGVQDAGLRGHRVALFANTAWYLSNFRLALARHLRRCGADVLLLSPPGPETSAFHAEGFRWLAVPFRRRSLWPHDQLVPIARLARIYARERPSLAHHFTVKCAFYGSLAARVGGGPVVVNALAGLGSAFGERTDRRPVTTRLARTALRAALRAHPVIVQNPDDQARLLAEGLATSETCVLIPGSGVDLDRFQPTHGPERPLTVLFAARLLRTKGVLEFADLARTLGARYPEVRFVIAGAPDAGNPDSLSTSEMHELGQNPSVSCVGHVTDMAGLLGATHVVVLPTTYGEGVPRVLVEGAACGLPLVATDVSGCREIVRPGVNGRLVPPGRPSALARAVDELIRSPGLRARFGAASRRIAQERYSETDVNGATVQVYHRALGAA